VPDLGRLTDSLPYSSTASNIGQFCGTKQGRSRILASDLISEHFWRSIQRSSVPRQRALPATTVRTSLQSSFVQLVLVRRSNHRTVPSSPHDRKVYGSLGTVMICHRTQQRTQESQQVYKEQEREQKNPGKSLADTLSKGTPEKLFLYIKVVISKKIFM